MISVGIIGLGKISVSNTKNAEKAQTTLTHASTIKSLANFELKYGIDVSPEARENFEQSYHAPAFDSKSVGELRGKADFLVVATNTETHLEAIELAMKLAPKLILLEKPVDISLSRSSEILQIQNKFGIPIVVNYQRNCDPVFRDIRERVINKRVSSETRIVAFFSGEWLNIGSHLVSLTQFLFGDKDVKSLYSNLRDDILILSSPYGKAHIVNLGDGKENVFVMRIHGSDMHIEYDSEKSTLRNFMAKNHDVFLGERYWDSDGEVKNLNANMGLTNVYLNVIRYFEKQGHSLTSLSSALKTMEFLTPGSE